MNLFTIGYEGRSADELPSSVAASGVTTVVDVRDLPLIRKRGFSKTALASSLAGAGVEYLHERRLGSPRPLRDYVKTGGDWAWFAGAFREGLGAAKWRVCCATRPTRRVVTDLWSPMHSSRGIMERSSGTSRFWHERIRITVKTCLKPHSRFAYVVSWKYGVSQT